MKKTLITLFLMVTQSISAQVTVGFDSSCDYDESLVAGGIQQAIDDGHTEVRVTNEQPFTQPIIIGNDLVLKGGYNSCADAQLDNQSNNITVIDGSLMTQSIIKIDTNTAVRNIVIDSFELKNSSGGNGSNYNYAGGLSIYRSSGDILLNNTYIHHNQNNFIGGGVSIKNDDISPGSALVVNMTDVLITNNTSIGSGGGLNCSSNGTITINVSGASGISYNHSDTHGGGVHLSNCSMNYAAGTTMPDTNNPFGIHANTANKDGGGLNAINSSVVNLTGSTTTPVNVTANTSNLDESSTDDGGGIHASGSSSSSITTVNASNVLIANNEAKNASGGGVYADFYAQVNFYTHQRNCSWSDFCNLIRDNRAKYGGAINAERDGFITVKSTEITGNRATSSGSVGYLRDDNSALLFEGVLIHHNGGADHTNFSDFYLIVNGFGDNNVTIAYSSIVDNESQFASVSAYSGASGNLQLLGSIVDDPGVQAVSVSGTATVGNIECVIIANDASVAFIPNSSQVFVNVPAFVDRNNGDYHLDESMTVGIDRCEASVYVDTTFDMDGELRGRDHPDFINDTGIYDIGVDEVGNADVIFKSSFEGINP